MFIELKIQADNEKDIQKIAKVLAELGYDKVAPSIPNEPVKVEASIENKVVKPAVVKDKTVVVEKAPETVEAPETAPETVDFGAIREQIKAVATKLVTEGKQPQANAVLQEVGVKKISQIPDDQLEYVLEKMKGL